MKVAVTIVAGSILLDVTAPLSIVHAADPSTIEQVQDKILKAFDPLIKVIMTLSYPIAGVMLSWGALRFMLGQREQAINTIQNTAIGYIVVQMSPLLLKLLASIGGAVV